MTLALVVPHGVFWSGLLSASGAYMMSLLPEKRRGEGISYWGLSSIIAIAVAPLTGFWIYRFGWLWVCAVMLTLNLIMTAIATTLKEMKHDHGPGEVEAPPHGVLDWRVFFLALTVFCTLFVRRDHELFGAVRRVSRHRPEEHLSDHAGRGHAHHPAVVGAARRPVRLPPDLRAVPAPRDAWPVDPPYRADARVDDDRRHRLRVRFGSAFPVFTAYVMQRVDPRRRGAAHGAIIAAFDTGIGTGSTSMG